tara:strand:+ start:1507 stop:2151 length:645 start_codon:yes stop_codon:yes gene_type:complete
MKISILISKNSWANQYRDEIKKNLRNFSKKLIFIYDHKKIKKNTEVNIIFSYFKKIEKRYLKLTKYNLIPHESNLPRGRGMSPITWQILKNKNYVTFSLIEANENVDSGNIYFQKKIKISEILIFDEIKKLQLKTNLKLIIKFLNTYKKYGFVKSKKQTGKATYYKLRKPQDHYINLNKSIKSQFNLLRTSDNKNYPAFFNYKSKKFFLKISKK